MSSPYCPTVKSSEWLEPESELDWRKAERPRSEIQRRLALIDEIIARAFVSTQTVSAEMLLQERFSELADRWERDTSHVSSITKKVMHPCYQIIMGMGPDMVPILIRDMQVNRRDWLWALYHLTQENPVRTADAGNFDKMIAAWVDWQRKKRRE